MRLITFTFNFDLLPLKFDDGGLVCDDDEASDDGDPFFSFVVGFEFDIKNGFALLAFII